MSESAHWLEGVLEKAGKTLEGDLSLPNSLPLEDAWEKASEASGVHQSELADMVALFFHLPRADLEEVESKALKLVPEALAHEFNILPLKEDYRRLVVATADPTNLEAEQSVGFASGRGISLVVASHAELREAILAQYSPDKDVARILFQVQPDIEENLDDIRLIEEEDDPTPSLEDAASGPLVNLTNVILKEAVEAGASDIHLQPMAHGGVIRYRIDGVLRNSGNMPLSVLIRVVSRIKIMAKLDIADRLRPQDGRAKVGFGDRQVDLRISTVPTRSAEKMVIRILDSEEAKALEDVGFQEPELTNFKDLLTHREGIVVVTGPTGSGKTTSLYAALQHIHDENINIMTSVYVALSVIIAFGVVYNSARIQLSERARELASLRVLGFTRGEVSRVLLIELAVLAVITVAAIGTDEFWERRKALLESEKDRAIDGSLGRHMSSPEIGRGQPAADRQVRVDRTTSQLGD